MRLLVDECLSSDREQALRAAGHEVLSAREEALGRPDEEVLALAHGEGRILITFDKDFGDLAVLRGQAHSGILRLPPVPPARPFEVVSGVLARSAEELARGAIVTIRKDRVSIRGAESAQGSERA